jgi:alkanesulfonate monooxygenase SsuD/methylene tetrahydromethanopterin reductase-like flavin-dependent oxidoreductase (luciferase family)
MFCERSIRAVPARAPLHLAVALDGAGWHPAAWRGDGARPGELLTAGYWVDLVREAEAAHLDFVTFEDSMALQSEWRGIPDDRVDRVRGRLDAVLVACRVAPATSGVGLVPVATTTHTEPFHISKAIATLDYVSDGRAGVQVRVSSTPQEAAQFGRRTVPDRGVLGPDDPAVVRFVSDLFDEAADFVEVVRRLWDSWEDGAEIRDATTGRFIDRDKLHYIDFQGRWFNVRGPSVTPRPPQGQPVVAALAHAEVPYRLAARCADIAFVTPVDVDAVRAVESAVRAEEALVDRPGSPLRVFVDLVVFLDDEPGAARARVEHLDRLAGKAVRSDAFVFAGTPAELAELLLAWWVDGVTGFRLRPGVLAHDLEAVTRRLVPVLQERRAFRRSYEARTLRGLLGLERPANRYAVAPGGPP